MKVLFVCSGNSVFGIAPFIKDQAADLIKNGIELDFFLIKGKGIIGYLKNLFPLRKKIKHNNYDIIHAHYIFPALLSILTFSGRKVIASFMGSDTYGDVNEKGKKCFLSYLNTLLNYMAQPFLSKIIVKSQNIEKYVYLRNKCIKIPNGVNLDKFKPLDKEFCRRELGLSFEKKYILFLGDKNNPRKNFNLVKNSFNKLKIKNIELLTPYPVNHDLVVKYLNAADVIVFTSYLEGSPNVIKEAMACNCPIVSTDVGDVKWIIGNTKGCYITSFDPDDVALKIKLALEFSEKYGKTNGRQRIIDLGLDSDSIAKKIIDVYKEVINK